MMFSILRNFLTQLPKVVPRQNVTTALFHFLSKPNILIQPPTILPQSSITGLLVPKILNVIPRCGFKVKGRLRRRCKDCYFVVRDQRLYVICKTHPKHKQMSMVKKEKNTWILTHATMGKIRPW